MKKLFLIWLFSGSLDSFSQDTKTLEYPPKPIDGRMIYLHSIGQPCSCSQCEAKNKPDTIRAILLVTLGYRQQGIAHARMGFVVISDGKRPVYLDCQKKALKLPMVGWNYQVIDPNYKKL